MSLTAHIAHIIIYEFAGLVQVVSSVFAFLIFLRVERWYGVGGEVIVKDLKMRG